MINLEDIRDRWNNGEYTVHMDISRKLPDGYIFDEDLSVKRNRELVAQHNLRVDELLAEKRARQNELDCKFYQNIIEYLKETYKLSEEQAKAVNNLAYSEHHSFMGDYFSYLDTYAEFAVKIISKA